MTYRGHKVSIMLSVNLNKEKFMKVQTKKSRVMTGFVSNYNTMSSKAHTKHGNAISDSTVLKQTSNKYKPIMIFIQINESS